MLTKHVDMDPGIWLEVPNYKAKGKGPRGVVVRGPPSYKTNRNGPGGGGGLRAPSLQHEKTPRYKTKGHAFACVCPRLTGRASGGRREDGELRKRSIEGPGP